MNTNDTLKLNNLDKETLPTELSTQQHNVDVKNIIALNEGDSITFSYGDYVAGAEAFNQYLEANIPPGKMLTLDRNRCLSLIKQLALTLNTGGLASLPQICLAEDCDRYNSCPIVLSRLPPPVGEACPIEKMEALNHVRKLAADFGSDRTYADQLMIQGVGGLQILKSRVFSDMSNNPSPVVESDKGIDPRGNVIKEKVANPNFDVLNMIMKAELVLLKGLNMTAQERMKNMLNSARTTDAQAASYRKKLAELKSKHGIENSDIIDVEANIIDGGDKVDASSSEEKVYGGVNKGGDGGVSLSSIGDSGDINKGNGGVEGEGKDVKVVERKSIGRSYKFNPGESPFEQRAREVSSTNTNVKRNDHDMEEVE